MNDVRDHLRALDCLQPPDLWDKPHKPGADRWLESIEPPRARRIVVAVAAIALALATTAYLLFAFRSDPGSPATSPASPPSTPSSLAYENIPVDHDALSVAAGNGSVWVSTYDPIRNRPVLDRIDPSTGAVTRAFPLADLPSFLAAGGGSVWATMNPGGMGRVLMQLDASTGEVIEKLPGYYGPVVVAVDGSVWAIREGALGGSEVVHLVSDSLVARVPVASAPVDMVEAAGSVWVLLAQADSASHTELVRIDEASGAVLARPEVRSAGMWLAGNDQGVWLASWWANKRGTSTFVSATDDSVTPFGGIYNFRPFAVADGHVWFIAGPGDGPIRGICGLNIDTHEADVCADVSGPDLEGARDPGAYESATNTIWAGQYLQPVVTRVSGI